MKEIRVQLSDQEYIVLKAKADGLGISLRQMALDCLLGVDSTNTPVNLARSLLSEISTCRQDINQIMRIEIQSEFGLFEDDIIRIETAMHRIESLVATFISTVLKGV